MAADAKFGTSLHLQSSWFHAHEQAGRQRILASVEKVVHIARNFTRVRRPGPSRVIRDHIL